MLTPNRLARQRSQALYAALAILFVIAGAYHLRTVEQRFPQWFGVKSVHWPFLLDAEDEPYFRMVFLQPNAKTAGLRESDVLIALNGTPARSRSAYADRLAASHPGDMLDVTFQRKGKPLEHARVRLEKFVGGTDLVSLLVIVFMPALCLALGFWVVLVRPRDVRSWLLLALLLSIAGLFNSFADFWSPPSIRTLAVIYFQLQAQSLPGWLFLLGLYFPEPFPSSTFWKGWKWLLWTALTLWAVWALAHVSSFAIELHSISAALPINRLIARIHAFGQLLDLALVLGFIICIGAKYRTALSADAKRRLRVLYAGTAVSLIPFILVFTIASLKGVAAELFFSNWLMVAVYLAFLLLPLTLAYVVVVQRAMDVRVVIRQGLQYTLARRGVFILQLLLSAVLFVAITLLMTSHALRPLSTVAILAAGLWSIFLLHGASQRVATWVDRRFFRDAYNAEQILSDLAEKVRTIVETQPLLEIVTERIAESLHVKRLAVLLGGNGWYRPAHSLGYSSLPEAVFAGDAATVQVLKSEKEPVRVYFDDAESWIYKTSQMSDAERAQLTALQPELLLPLSVRDDLIGFMSLGQKISEAPYSGTDLRLLRSVLAQTGLALEVARLTAAIGTEIAQRERVNRELEIAREVQEHLFPQHCPQIPGLDYGGFCRPARTVGGDYYDFLELPDGKFGIAIGDVSGKGIGAALMMASLEASLRGQASVVRDLAELVRRVNNLVFGASSVSRYATFFYAEYDLQTHHLSYVNAGHNPPAILRRDADGHSFHVHRLETGGPVVGLFQDCRYEQDSFPLERGDSLLLFTDGVSESMNNEDEEWGEERLIEFAKTCLDFTAADAMNRIMAAACQFAAGAPQHDDMTVVILRALA